MNFKKVKIKDLVSLINGHAFKSEDWETEGRRIIRIQNLNNPQASYNLTTKEVPEKYIVHKDDILVAWAGSLGVYQWNEEEPALLNQHLFRVEFKSTDIVKKYLKYVMRQALLELQQKARGVGLKHLKKSQIDNYEFKLPEKKKQEEAVNILDNLAGLIEKRKLSLKLIDEYLISCFNQMFGDPILNPKNWNLTKIEELEIKSGGTPKRNNAEYFNGNINWAKSTDIRGEKIISTEEKITELGLKESNCHVHPEKTILIAMYGNGKTRGSVGLLEIESACNQACAAILPNKRFHPLFLFSLLKYSYEYLRNLGKGGNRKNLSLKTLKQIELIQPEKNLQEKYAHIYLQYQELKKSYIKSLNLKVELFESMVYQTFSQKQIKEIDEIDSLLEDHIQLELFLNTIKASDFKNEEIYSAEINDLFEILDRTQMRNQNHSGYLEGLIQRLEKDKILLETNKENKYRLSDEIT